MPRLRKKDVENLKNSLMEKSEKESLDEDELPSNISESDLIPTGSTHLNLACSDTHFGGYLKGRIINIIGDSDTAKSFCGLTTFAAMANNPLFDDYLLFLDDIENALSINIPKMFGKKTASRIDFTTFKSNTIEQWFVNQMKALKLGKPFVYITDSFDYLDSEDSIERSEKMITQIEKKGESDGKTGYGMEKAKWARKIFRALKSNFVETNSLSIIISQTSTDIRPIAHGKKTRQCGEAIKFACTHEIWLKRIVALKDKEVEIGSLIEAKVSKNRVTGKKRYARFPVYYDYGVDDIGSCINYLVEQGKIEQKGAWFSCVDLFKDQKFQKSDLIEQIEKNNLEPELQILMQKTWNEVEDSIKLNRKPRWH